MNFQKEHVLSVALPDRLIVIVVPVFTVPVASNSHTEVVTPSPATPPTVLVYSPSFVQSPVPPETLVWSLVLPSAVDLLSVTTVRMPKLPDDSELVAVLKVKLELLVLLVPVPSVPTLAIVMSVRYRKSQS